MILNMTSHLPLRSRGPLAALATVACAALAAPAPAAAAGEDDPPPGAREVEQRHPRAVVADGRTGRVHVVDLRSGRRVGAFRLGAPAYLAEVGDDRHVAAIHYQAGRVRVVDGGSWAEDHGEHAHRWLAPPRLTPFVLRVPRPSHVMAHGDRVAIFADGDGSAHVLALAGLTARRPQTQRVPTGRAQHGVAVPWGAGLLVSTPDPAGEDGGLPTGIAQLDAAGVERARFGGCPELHGEAAGERWAAFACDDGVLLLEGDDALRATKIPYPAGFGGEERRVWTLRSDASGRRLVGTLGATRVLVIDRATRASRVVRAARRIAALDVDAGSGRAYALTTDGRAHAIDARRGRIVRSARVTRAFRTGGEDPRPTPSLAAGAGRVVVSDPSRQRVHVLRAASLERRAAVRVPGAPQRLALAGTR
jgi:hypothetical protein